MSEITIRDATIDDVPAIARIYGHWVLHGTSSFELEAPDEAEMRRRFETLKAGGFPYLVAEAGGRVIGYAYAGPYRPRPAYRYTLEDSIYLDPDVRGRGVSRRLLQALIDRCRADGYRNLMAVIGDSGNEASIGVHTALGFRHVGTARNIGFKFDRWLDVVTMQLVL